MSCRSRSIQGSAQAISSVSEGCWFLLPSAYPGALFDSSCAIHGCKPVLLPSSLISFFLCFLICLFPFHPLGFFFLFYATIRHVRCCTFLCMILRTVATLSNFFFPTSFLPSVIQGFKPSPLLFFFEEKTLRGFRTLIPPTITI